MYRYPDIVTYLKNQGNKESAVILDNVFFSFITKYIPCDWFIEAGAFEATASMTVKSKIPNCHVYAFEANPDNYQHFKKEIKNINYIQQAISNYCGEIIFKQQAHGSNGMIFPKVRGNNSVKLRTLDKETVYNDIKVSCTTLDDFFHDKIKSTETVGMWLDLEGTAYEALTASTKIIDKLSFLKIEVEDKQYWENQKLSQDIIDFLGKHNMTPLFRDFEGTSVLQYNILFSNNRFIDSKLDSFLEEVLNGK